VAAPILASGCPGASEAVSPAVNLTDPTLTCRCQDSPNPMKLTIRIPAPLTIHDSGPAIENEPNPDEDLTIT
jgi:hypothetical protein